MGFFSNKEEASNERKLKFGEQVIAELDGGFLFVRNNDGIARYMSNEQYDAHIESLQFVEPEPEPPIPQGKFFDRSRPS